MKENILISIIIPVYNVEKYVKKCLDSILNQTLKEIEIIIINDASVDASERIILDYKEKDYRIKYFKQEVNQGQGYARNLGVQKAKGKYILFVDSDDYIKMDALEILYNEAEKMLLDVLEANYYIVKENRILKKENKLFKSVLSGDDYFETIPYTVGVVWNKLWRTAFIKDNKLAFKDIFYEDILFISESIECINRIYRVNYYFYYYVERENSTMTSKVTTKHISSQLKLINYLERHFLESVNHNSKGKDQRLKLLLYSFSRLTILIRGFKEKKELKLEAKKIITTKYPQYRKYIMNCSKLGFKQKVFFYISPYLVGKILEIVKR